MSDTYYTCDYCVESGHDEVACHPANNLSVYGDKVVCDGCRECGDFPEFDDDDAVLLEFIPPDKARITELEAAGAKIISAIRVGLSQDEIEAMEEFELLLQGKANE